MTTDEGLQSVKKSTRKGSRWIFWIFWWRIDPAELQRQVIEYHTLGWLKSARKISVLCLLFSAAVTTMFIVTALDPSNFDSSGFADVAVMLILAVFIYFGHRWAMIGAMLLWTVEKAILIIGNPPNGGLIFAQMAWWAGYMHAFWLAFQVERKRKTFALAPSTEKL